MHSNKNACQDKNCRNRDVTQAFSVSHPFTPFLKAILTPVSLRDNEVGMKNFHCYHLQKTKYPLGIRDTLFQAVFSGCDLGFII